VVEIANSDQNH